MSVPSEIRENPFATRFVRPGSLPFLPAKANFAGMEEGGVEAFAARLVEQKGWGEIIGPHGSGKSTLLFHLLERLEEQGWLVHRVELHEGESALPIHLKTLSHREHATLLAIDGYEQLSRWNRWRVRRFCRRRRWGLIITSHVSTGLPTLYEMQPNAELARRVVAKLLEGRPALISEETVQKAFVLHQENFREMLFELYDAYERASRRETSFS